MTFQIPDRIRGERSTMYDRFVQLANEHGETKAYATELVKLLPLALRQAPVWFDNLARLWRYEYGFPLDRLPEDTVIVGTNQFFPVAELFAAMKLADRWLSREQLLQFRERIANQRKHIDALFEMRPVAGLRTGLSAHFEVPGLGMGNTTCDWQIKGKILKIALDVKYRSKSLIAHMSHMIPDLNRGTNSFRPPAPDPSDLFKSVEGKFKEHWWIRQLQGVWIHTSIKEDESKLVGYFDKTLNRKKVHFAILSDWKDDAFILARSKLIRSLLRRTFDLRESKRWVSNDYA